MDILEKGDVLLLLKLFSEIVTTPFRFIVFVLRLHGGGMVVVVGSRGDHMVFRCGSDGAWGYGWISALLFKGMMQMFSFTCQKTVSYELSRTFHFKMEKGIFSPMGKKLWPTPSFLVFFIWIADITLELNYSQFFRQLWRVWNLRSKCNTAECHFLVDYWPKTLQINYGDVVNHPCVYDRCLVVH